MGRLAVDTALRFVTALDEAELDERTARLRELVTPNATWWIDTGRDRLAGRRNHDPGDKRPWPLHGTMPMLEKLELISRIGPEIFPERLGRRIVSRAFGTENVALIEAQGEGIHVSGKPYRNRCAFVIDIAGSRVRAVREYLDTLHAEDVFGGDRPSKRSTAPLPEPREVSPANKPERLALALWPALVAGDLDTFGALFTPDGAWWTDSGTDRDHGVLDGCGRSVDGWPLHGLIPIAEKLASMRARGKAAYTGSSIAVTPVRLFSDKGLVALEAEGYATLSTGLVYQNRYVFVIETDGDRIRQVREYCDTLHLIDVTGVRST